MLSEVIQQTLQAGGSYRVKFKYTLDDGRERITSYINARNQAHIDQLLIDKLPPFLESVAKSDALEAQALGIEVVHKTATLIDVYYAYLVVGFFEDDPIDSYLSMNIVAQKVIDLGLSIQEVADLFKVEVDVMQKAVDKWSYLHSNRATLAQYKVIKDGI